MTFSKTSSVADPSGVPPAMPALANTTSNLPNFPAPFLIAASVAAMSVASAVSASAFGPSSFAAAASVSLLRPVITTLAPSATNSFAVASPMPLLPPVIRAVLFFSLTLASSGCIIKLGLPSRPSGFITQPHKRVSGDRTVRTRKDLTMVKRTSFEGDGCPIARSLEALGHWWSLLIIREALSGRRRFGEFQKNLGLAKNILTARLRTLVDHGILTTAPASDGSVYQEYVLTPKGRGVFPVLVALRQWSEAFDDHPEQITTMLVDRETGRPVRKLELHSRDGRLLGFGDTAVRPRAARDARRQAQ